MFRKFHVLPTQLYLCVLCGSQDKQRLFFYTTLTVGVFIAETASVYCAVRTGSLYIKFSKIQVRKGKTRFLLRSSVRSVSLLSCNNNNSCSRFIVSQQKQHLRQRIKVLPAPDTVTCLSPCAAAAADIYDAKHKQNKFPQSRSVYREEIENAPPLCASALHTKVSTTPI